MPDRRADRGCGISSEAPGPECRRRPIRTEEEFLAAYGMPLEEAWTYVADKVRRVMGPDFSAEAEDAAADVMEALCRNPPSSRVEFPRAYLAVTARSRATSAFKRLTALKRGGGRVLPLEAQEEWDVPPDWEPRPEEEMLFMLLRQDLRMHMEAHCSPEQLDVWLLEFDTETGWSSGLTNVEIAGILGVAKGTVDRRRAAVRKMALQFVHGYGRSEGGAP